MKLYVQIDDYFTSKHYTNTINTIILTLNTIKMTIYTVGF
jgi:hypothetical protein